MVVTTRIQAPLVQRRLLNHDIMSCTADGVPGNHLYSGRALGISEPWDIVQLHPDLESNWPAIHAHYLRIGLSHSEQVLWHTVRVCLGEYAGLQPSVFYFGPEECRYWGDDQWLEATEFINSKNNFIALAEELGVPVPRTRCFDRVEWLDAGKIPDHDFPCYLKAAVSVSGVGIYRCEDRDDLVAAQRRFAQGTPVQVQEEVNARQFLNLQYQVRHGRLERLEVSEQILDGCAHQGNRVPASCQPWSTVEPMAEWLAERGLKGVFAFDVAVIGTPQGTRYEVIECNPRFNGASYPTLIANKLGIEQWTSATFSTRYRRLRDIELGDLEYNPKTGEGVVFINWGTVLVGKLMLLVAGLAARREHMLSALEERLLPA